MTPREPVPEMTPRVGRWMPTKPREWVHDCVDGTASYWYVSTEVCPYCDTVRPPLPETPAPTLPTPSPRFLTDAQVLGKEPIAGVDAWDGHDYARDRESLEECVRQAATNVRKGIDSHIWLPTLVAHAITFLDDATLLHALRAAPAVETGVSDGRFEVLTADEGNLWAWAVENAGIDNAATFIREATVKALRAPRTVADASPTEVMLSDGCVVSDAGEAAALYAKLYHELLNEVVRKHPNESCHETARRYIRERESAGSHDAGASRATPAAEVRDEH